MNRAVTGYCTVIQGCYRVLHGETGLLQGIARRDRAVTGYCTVRQGCYRVLDGETGLLQDIAR